MKENKLVLTFARYENFKMMKDESILQMNSRFTYIVNNFVGLLEPISKKNQGRKILRSLLDKYYSNRNVIRESRDLTTLTIVELCGNLVAYENERFAPKEKEEKKTLPLRVNMNEIETQMMMSLL